MKVTWKGAIQWLVVVGLGSVVGLGLLFAYEQIPTPEVVVAEPSPRATPTPVLTIEELEGDTSITCAVIRQGKQVVGVGCFPKSQLIEEDN